MFWEENQDIWMISERSCDTDDWSNDAENSVLDHRNKLHLKCKKEKIKIWNGYFEI